MSDPNLPSCELAALPRQSLETRQKVEKHLTFQSLGLNLEGGQSVRSCSEALRQVTEQVLVAFTVFQLQDDQPREVDESHEMLLIVSKSTPSHANKWTHLH